MYKNAARLQQQGYKMLSDALVPFLWATRDAAASASIRKVRKLSSERSRDPGIRRRPCKWWLTCHLVCVGCIPAKKGVSHALLFFTFMKLVTGQWSAAAMKHNVFMTLFSSLFPS